MRRLIRPVAVLVIAVLMQLVLMESGYACWTSSASSAEAAMAGMSMPGEHSPTAPDQPDDKQPPCNLPWAPNGCQTMAPCAPAALVVASTPEAPVERPHDAPPVLVPLAPPSLSFAPELPPPKA